MHIIVSMFKRRRCPEPTWRPNGIAPNKESVHKGAVTCFRSGEVTKKKLKHVCCFCGVHLVVANSFQKQLNSQKTLNLIRHD